MTGGRFVVYVDALVISMDADMKLTRVGLAYDPDRPLEVALVFSQEAIWVVGRDLLVEFVSRMHYAPPVGYDLAWTGVGDLRLTQQGDSVYLRLLSVKQHTEPGYFERRPIGADLWSIVRIPKQAFVGFVNDTLRRVAIGREDVDIDGWLSKWTAGQED